MLNGDMREASADTIKLSEIDPETLNGVLEWVSSCDYVETIRMAQQKAEKLKTDGDREKKSDSEEERGDNGETEFYNSTFLKRRQHLKPPGHIILRATKLDVDRSVTNLLLNILLAANRFDMPDLISLCVGDLKLDLNVYSVCDGLEDQVGERKASQLAYVVQYIPERKSLRQYLRKEM